MLYDHDKNEYIDEQAIAEFSELEEETFDEEDEEFKQEEPFNIGEDEEILT